LFVAKAFASRSVTKVSTIEYQKKNMKKPFRLQVLTSLLG
jgi:hypothetical protein